jgi:hypothetical protein
MKTIHLLLFRIAVLLAGFLLSHQPTPAQSPFTCMSQESSAFRWGTGAQTGTFPCHATPETWTVPAGPVSVTVSGGAGIGYQWNGGPSEFVTADYGQCTGGSPFSPRLSVSFSEPVMDVTVYSMSGTVSSNAVPYKLTDNRGTVVQINPVVNPDGSVFFPPATFSGRGITSIVLEPVGSVTAPWEFSISSVTFNPQCSVTSVQWQQIQGPLDVNPNAGGGTRIFPDRQTPTGTVMTRVRASATTQLGANKTVYFRAFDLDDPSTDATAVDPNGASAGDNRGTPQTGTLSATSAVTDASGNAFVNFDVTMHPGDNFVVAASDDQAYLNSLTPNASELVDGSGRMLPTTKASKTQLLTVWRKLHVEMDTMGPVAGNRVTGTVGTLTPNTSINRTVIAAGTTLEANRFENGRIVLDRVGSYPVISNTTNSVTVQGIITSVPKRTAYTLYDDDDFNSDDGTALDGDTAPGGSTGEQVTALPQSLSLMQNSDNPALNVFAPAYIRPVYDGGGSTAYNTTNVTFRLNVTETPASVDSQLNLGRNSGGNENDGFWIVYLQIDYQGGLTSDTDPATDSPTGGATTVIGSTDLVTSAAGVPQGGQGSLIFIEASRDGDLTYNLGNDFQVRTPPHEVGHQFGLQGDAAGFGIMSQTGSGEPLSFVDSHLNILRWRVKSPGQP